MHLPPFFCSGSCLHEVFIEILVLLRLFRNPGLVLLEVYLTMLNLLLKPWSFHALTAVLLVWILSPWSIYRDIGVITPVLESWFGTTGGVPDHTQSLSLNDKAFVHLPLIFCSGFCLHEAFREILVLLCQFQNPGLALLEVYLTVLDLSAFMHLPPFCCSGSCLHEALAPGRCGSDSTWTSWAGVRAGKSRRRESHVAWTETSDIWNDWCFGPAMILHC